MSDGLVVAFLFSWAIGLLIELQRSEVLSLEKFLHLPCRSRAPFLINYFSSLLSVTLALFIPSMIAFGVALAFSHGPALLLVLPLLAAFVFMVTALTYQFQGWLAALMVNKRRRWDNNRRGDHGVYPDLSNTESGERFASLGAWPTARPNSPNCSGKATVSRIA